MHCTRLTNSLRIDSDSMVSACCAMHRPPRFRSEEEMKSSSWFALVQDKFSRNEWPVECAECERFEAHNIKSFRQTVNAYSDQYTADYPDFLVVDISFDTVCNAACHICHSGHSSMIAKLYKEPSAKGVIPQLPSNIDPARIFSIDIMGGEPAVSPNVKRFMTETVHSLPNLKDVGICTNGARPVIGLEQMLDAGVKVRMTFSIDGTGSIFEYGRWPIKWNRFTDTLSYYEELVAKYPSLLLMKTNMVVSSLSAISIVDVQRFSAEHNLEFRARPIEHPAHLRVQKNNALTRAAKERLQSESDTFVKSIVAIMATEDVDNTEELVSNIAHSDAVRKIRFNDYYAEYGIRI